MDIRILPFLMAVGLFVAATGLLYANYQETADDYQDKVTDMEMTSKYGPYWQVQNIRGSVVTVPVNDTVAYWSTYPYVAGPNGTAPNFYYQGTNFVWSETDTYFYIEATWTSGVHSADQLGLLIMTWSTSENAWVSSSWMSVDLPTTAGDYTSIQVGRDWFLEHNISAFQTFIGVNLLAVASGGLLAPAAIAYDAIYVSRGAYQYGSGGRYAQGVWPYNVQLQVGKMTSASPSTDNGLTKGYIEIKWSQYAGSLGESASDLVGKIGSTIRGAFASLFGAAFGDYGRQFVDTLTSVLTMDVPGMPTAVRAMIAIPLNLALVFIIATFIVMFIPFVGGS